MNKKAGIGIVVGVLTVLVVASFSYVAARNGKTADEYGYVVKPQPVSEQPVADERVAKVVPQGDVEETTLQVSKLSCGSCLYTIQTELNKYDGMVGMKADLGSGIVVISHTKDFAPARIATVITETGYPAKIVDAGVFKGAAQAGAKNSRGCGGGCCSFPRPTPKQG